MKLTKDFKLSRDYRDSFVVHGGEIRSRVTKCSRGCGGESFSLEKSHAVAWYFSGHRFVDKPCWARRPTNRSNLTRKIFDFSSSTKRKTPFGGSSFCGGGEIRTHGPVTQTPVFKTGAFDHSATPPIGL